MAPIFTYTTYIKDKRFDKANIKVLMLQNLKEKATPFTLPSIGWF